MLPRQMIPQSRQQWFIFSIRFVIIIGYEVATFPNELCQYKFDKGWRMTFNPEHQLYQGGTQNVA